MDHDATSGRPLALVDIDSPVGPLTVGTSATGLSRLSFGQSEAQELDDAGPPGGPAYPLGRPLDHDPLGGPADPAGVELAGRWLERATAELAEYFAGDRRRFTVPIDWSAMADARLAVLRTLYESVPYGRTVSYGRLAATSGRPGAARLVGTIMGSNPIAIVVPCHRVLASDGTLGGYGPGVPLKRILLELEGVLPASLL